MSGVVGLIAVLAGASVVPTNPRDLASVDATASVAITALPDKRAGGKDLTSALGPDRAARIRSDVVDTWTGLRGFTAILPEGGQWRLDLSLHRITRSLGDPEAAEQRRLRVEVEATWVWRNDAFAALEGASTVSGERLLDEAPRRADIADCLDQAFTEIGRRSFAGLYEAYLAGFSEPASAGR